MHLAAEHRVRHRAADHRRRDVVEEARQHEHHAPAARSRPSSRRAGSAAARPGSRLSSKWLRQQREAEQQQQQVGQDHPLVQQVRAEARDAGAGLEAGEARACRARSTASRSARRAACGGGTARRRASTAANRMKSTGTGPMAGPLNAAGFIDSSVCSFSTQEPGELFHGLAFGDQACSRWPAGRRSRATCRTRPSGCRAAARFSRSRGGTCVNAACGQVSRPRAARRHHDALQEHAVVEPAALLAGCGRS